MSPEASDTRPPKPKSTKSFSRYEPLKQTATRSRSSSLQDPLATTVESPVEALSDDIKVEKVESSIFERQGSDDIQVASEDVEETSADGYDDLPIEIQSLMERFLESLSAKVHPAPLSIDRLSELYQDFYVHVEPQIATHIAALQSRIFRDKSPAPSVASTSSSRSRTMKDPKSPAKQKSTDDFRANQQMLTPSEINDKRKIRRQLELRKSALEEAVERGVCEKVYPRLWRHKSTDDEERDERLRSRAASLAVINIGLKELLSTATSPRVEQPTSTAEAEDNAAKEQLTDARNSLKAMNSDRYPLGKLRHLTAVHKSIVDVLSRMYPSSSADEVLPTLIYTIITSEPEGLHIGSNFNFIQRFRGQNKMDGEAAYCLTNLEAAITFLDTVDISSIRPDEAQGSTKATSQASTPRSETPNPLYRGILGAAPPPNTSTQKPPSSPKHSRRFSTMASDVVIHSADTTFNTIHGALDGSFKFLFGRLKEQQAASPHQSPKLAAPTTLEDARKLVSTPPPVEDEDKTDSSSMNEATEEQGNGTLAKSESMVSNMVGGRRREHSVDSNRSLGLTSSNPASSSTPTLPKPATPSAQATATYGDSVRNLGSTLNPLKGFAGLRGFGRSSPTPASSTPASSMTTAHEQPTAVEEKDHTNTQQFDWSGISPPIRRFTEMKEPKELTFFDVELLLRDYQRLAGAFVAAGGPPPG